MTRRPDAQTTVSNSIFSLVTGTPNNARNTTAIETHIMTFVSIGTSILLRNRQTKLGRIPAFRSRNDRKRLVHWWSAAARHRSGFFFVRNFGDEGFRREHQGRDGGSVLKGRTGHLGRIENTGRDHVGVVFGFGIESEVWLFRLANFAHNDRTFVAGIGNDQPDGLLESTLYYSYADLLVAFEFQLLKSRNGSQECDATARNDTFFHSSTGRMHRIFDARLLLLHFRLGRRADLDDSHTADKLRQPLLQLFAIVVGSRVFDLSANLFHAPFYGRALTAAFDDGGVVLVDDDLFRRAEILNLDVLQLDAEIFCDRTALSEGCDIVQHRLPAIAKARSFHGRRLQRAPQLVHNECCERFTFDVFSDNQQGAPHLRHLFQDRQKVFHRADLFFHNQDEAIFQYTLHPVRVGHKVRRQITTIELHPFDQVHRGLESLCFFDRDDAIFADFLHGFSDNVADCGVVIGRNRSHLRDHFAAHRFCEFLDLFGSHFNRFFDAALHGHRVCSRSHGLHALAEDRLCQNGGRRRAVTRHVAGLRCDFLHHLGAHILEGIFQLDLFRYRDAVFRDQRRTEFLIENHIAALRPQRDLDCIREYVNAAQDCLA